MGVAGERLAAGESPKDRNVQISGMGGDERQKVWHGEPWEQLNHRAGPAVDPLLSPDLPTLPLPEV